MKAKLTLCILAILGFITIALLDKFPAQIVCLLLLFTLFFMVMSSVFKNILVKYICIVVFSFSLPLALVEGYFYIALKADDKIIEEVTLQDPIPEPLLSQLDPAGTYKQRKVTRSMREQKTVIFDVIYTTDNEKRRVTPYAPQAKVAVVLLGCSFTFGDALNDEDTFGYKLGQILGKDFQVINLGVPGSGSHRILEQLEKGLPSLDKFSKVIFYYSAIEDHIRRAAGIVYWDYSGILYDLQDGKLVKMDDPMQAVPWHRNENVMKWLVRSYLYKKTYAPFENFFSRYDTVEKQVELQKALMHAISDIIHKKYAQSRFTILAWPPNTAQWFEPPLAGITSVNMEAWFPNFDEELEKYVIIKDGHPSAYTNDIVARELAKLVYKDAKALGVAVP